MSVYRKFTKNDLLHSTIFSAPKVEVAYGEVGPSNAWSGNSGVSGSISLYGGVRSRIDISDTDFPTSGISIVPLDPLDTHSIDKVIFVSGSYPSTGSIRYVRCTNTAPSSFTLITDTRWYEEHYRPIELLYNYYQNKNNEYFIGSHDYYSTMLLSQRGSPGPNLYAGPVFLFSGSFTGAPITSPSSSFSVEAWIKPLTHVSASVVMSQKHLWNVHVDTFGRLGFQVYSSASVYNTVTTVPAAKWSHVAAVVKNGTHVDFYINGVQTNTNVVLPGSIPVGSESQPLTVGGELTGSAPEIRRYGLDGFIHETRVWNKQLTPTEVLENYSTTLFNSSSLNLVHYARFNDGPRATNHGFAMGSGAFDYSPRAKHGHSSLWSATYVARWQPNDNVNFTTKKTRINLDVNEMRVVHVPSMFYGRQIQTGSLVLKFGDYNSLGIVRVVKDDGRGNLYLSGSTTADLSGEHYKGNSWRKVGSVFYSEGIIAITEPALFDTFNVASGFWDPTAAQSIGVTEDLFSAEFRGDNRIQTKTFMCRLGSGMANGSNNPTFSRVDTRGTIETDDDITVLEDNSQTTYITSVGIYNEDRKLVAIAKLAQPIRKRLKDKLNIRLRLDF